MELTPSDRNARFKSTRPTAKLREGRNEWFRITNLADVTEVYIFDEIGYFGVTASQLVDQLRDVTSPTINLHINSPGGEVFDGIAINSALRNHPATVNVYVDGIAASIASVIAMAGDTITMGPFSQMMIHDGLGLCVGNAADMREMADLLDKCSDTLARVYAERTGSLSRENINRWRTRMRAETWYSAEEAVAAGLADRVDTSRKATSNTANSFDLSIFAYNGRDEAPAPDGEADQETTDTDPSTGPAPQDGNVETDPTITPEMLDALRKAFGG